VARPRQALKGFARITLQPGETQTVQLPLRADDLRYWDAEADRWVLEARPVQVRLGAASDDIRLEQTIPITP
jgi:beta-glucosidase